MGVAGEGMIRARIWPVCLLGAVLAWSSSVWSAEQVAPASGNPAAKEAQLAKEAVAKNDLPTALSHFVKAANLAPENADYLHSIAMLNRKLGKNEQALDALLKVVRLAGEAGKQADVAQYNDAIAELRGALPEKFTAKVAEVAAFPPEKGRAAAEWSRIAQESATLLAKGDAAGAVKGAAQALAFAQANFGEGHYAVFVSLRDLAVRQFQAGAVAEAAAGLEKAVTLGSTLLGADHPELLQVQALQADLAEAGGDLTKAAGIRKAMRDGWVTAVGAEHPLTLAAGLAYARSLLNGGDIEQAFQWLEGACGKFEKMLGPFHPQGAECLTLQAMARGRKGDADGALKLYRQASRIYKAALPASDPVALAARIEAAELLRRDARFNEARKELEEVIALAAKEPAARQTLLEAKGAMAQVFEDSGEYDKAEPLLNEVLEGEKALLGAEHPNLLATRSRLAGVYRRQGRLHDAETLYAALLDEYRRLLGSEHQASINVMNNLGLVFENEGLYDQAEPLLRAALKSSQKLVGEENPETLAMLNNLALLHESQGNFDKAEPLYRSAITIAGKRMGEKHPDAVAFVNNLAYLQMLQHNYKEAAPLFEKVMGQWTETYGEAHQKTLKAMNNLARVRHKLGEKEVAEKLFKKTLALRKSVLGERHMDVLRTMRDLGALYVETGRPRDAEELLRKALELDEQVLGPQHPYTFETMDSLADALEALKDKKSLREAFEIRKQIFERRNRWLLRPRSSCSL
ncbi:MAG: tetratricopeptide repeat protein, partial [Magnetococcales bacterium]|nr:tetratricopeptide repeat protein [Magnetococcales bacterium]